MENIEKRAKNSFAWLEITGKCQLECGHCYADSGPQGTHGEMQLTDWLRALDQLADVGVRFVCIIGGEPTLHPDLGAIVDHALGHRMQVEVYTNLVHVSDEQWRLFERRRVSLATSYYSSDPDEHARIVGRTTLARTTANIEEARKRGIPIRVGMVRVLPAQRIKAAKQVLARFGIGQIGVDDLRGVGRGAGTHTPDVSALCGGCASGRLAITPDGDVYPCVFSRWLPVGNVLETPLTEILNGELVTVTRAELASAFASRPKEAAPAGLPTGKCDPECEPMATCDPIKGNGGACSPDQRGCPPWKFDGQTQHWNDAVQASRAHAGAWAGCTPLAKPPSAAGPTEKCDPTSCAATVGGPDDGQLEHAAGLGRTGDHPERASQSCDRDSGPNSETAGELANRGRSGKLAAAVSKGLTV